MSRLQAGVVKNDQDQVQDSLAAAGWHSNRRERTHFRHQDGCN